MLTVNIIGLAFIVLMIWWFWIKKPASLKASSDSVEIVVDNGGLHTITHRG